MNLEEMLERIVELARRNCTPWESDQGRRLRLVITDLHRFKPPVQVNFIKIIDEAQGYQSVDKMR